MEQNQGLKLLKELVKDIESLKFGESPQAELLYQRTKMYAREFFGLEYGADLVGLKFRVEFSTLENLQQIWQVNFSKLLAIAKTMLEQYAIRSAKTQSTSQVKYVQVEDRDRINALSEQIAVLSDRVKQLGEINRDLESKILDARNNRKRLKKVIVAAILFALCSALLWTFNEMIRWQWLYNHPKKIGIYVTFQIIIGLLCYRIIGAKKVLDWATVIALGVTLLQLI